MAGPAGEMAAGAAGPSRPRTPPVGREQLIDALKAAYVQGRLDRDEFEVRVGKVLASYAELDAVVADIPAGPTQAAPPPRPAPESHNKKVIQRGTAAGAGASMAFAAAGVAMAGGGALVGLILVPVVGLFVAVLLAGLMTLLSWVLDQGSSRQAPAGPPPGEAGRPAERLTSAHPAGPRRPIRPEPPAELARHRGQRLAGPSRIHRRPVGGPARVII